MNGFSLEIRVRSFYACKGRVAFLQKGRCNVSLHSNLDEFRHILDERVYAS